MNSLNEENEIKIIKRSTSDPESEGLTWKEKWEGKDFGLIECWKNGRKIAKSNPELTVKAKNGELPVLAWKGGFDKALKSVTRKYAPYYYLAMLQGIKGEDLNINPEIEHEITCTKTNMTTVFTSNENLYGKE